MMLGQTGRHLQLALLAVLAAFGLCLMAPGAWAQDFPPLTARVVDAANVIPADVEARLEGKLAALENQSQRQFVVVTIPDLQGYEISDFGYQLGRHWGIGSKQRNDGALLIVAPRERKVRIEVGYGLEGILTDGLSSLIVQQAIVPRFKAGDMPGGIETGADAVIQQLTLPEEEARKIAAQAKPVAQGETDWVGGFVWFFFLLFFVLPLFARMARRNGMRRGTGLGSIILWSVADGLAHGSRSGGWGSGGGFSGGGFSGGGGSFGGGGSSGSW